MPSRREMLLRLERCATYSFSVRRCLTSVPHRAACGSAGNSRSAKHDLRDGLLSVRHPTLKSLNVAEVILSYCNEFRLHLHSSECQRTCNWLAAQSKLTRS